MNIEEKINSILDHTDKIIQVSKALPEHLIRWKPSQDEWSVMEVLCHVEEATSYWLHEIKILVNHPGTEWGRGLKHEGRLVAVSKADQRKVQDVLIHIEISKKEVQEVLGTLSNKDLLMEAPSRNPRFGTKPMVFIVDHLLIEHLDTHLKQINRNIENYNKRNENI